MIKNLKYHFATKTKNAYRNFVGLMLDNKFDSIYRSCREYIFLEKNINPDDTHVHFAHNNQ